MQQIVNLMSNIKKIKLGLDIHGVIDANPNLFSIISNLLVSNDHEVHIITGKEISDDLVNKLLQFKIKYTHLFSITSYHKNAGSGVSYDDKGRPWMDEEVWNATKSWYCNKHKIDLHIDDSDIYGKYFKTPYLKYCKATLSEETEDY